MLRILKYPALILLCGFFLSQTSTTTKEPQAWNDIYFISLASPKKIAEIRKDFSVEPDELLQIEPAVPGRTGENSIYVWRAAIQHREAFAKAGIEIKEDAPFRHSHPDITERRRSSRFEDWLNGYKDEILTEKILREIARRHPESTRIFEIGRSLLNRPILALKISDRPEREEDEPAFLFNGGHHGNEVLAIDYVIDTALTFVKDPASYSGVEIWCVPLVNPDGLHNFWNKSAKAGRKNGRDNTRPHGWNLSDGVDLNRNYPFYWNSGHRSASGDHPAEYFYRGPAPASEPETKTMMRLASEHRFVMSLSYHTNAARILVPYTIDGAKNPYPQSAWRIARELAGRVRSHRSDEEYRAVRNLYPVDGTDQDWLFHTFGTIAFIVEGSYQSPDSAHAARSIEGLRPAALALPQLYRTGPTLTVHVKDRERRPLGASVRLVETAYLENESFQANPRTGRYDFILDEGGTWTVQASMSGYRTGTVKAECNSGICSVGLILTR